MTAGAFAVGGGGGGGFATALTVCAAEGATLSNLGLRSRDLERDRERDRERERSRFFFFFLWSRSRSRERDRERPIKAKTKKPKKTFALAYEREKGRLRMEPVSTASDSADQRVWKSETFHPANHKDKDMTCTLTSDHFSFSLRAEKQGVVSSTRTLPLSCLLAASCAELILNVTYYPLERKSRYRKRCYVRLTMSSPEHAAEWADAINRVLVTGKLDALAPMPRRHVLVLVNPFGGTKTATAIWREVVQPMWDECGMTYQITETQYAGHAKEIARTLNLSAYDAIVTVSGDGLFWELLNGLLTRPDWEAASNVPISVIPGGSGNALAFSAGFTNPETAAFQIARGKPRPFDVSSVFQSGYRMISFLMLSWGIVADVDFESERFRWMGKTRFTVSAVQRIIDLRHYKGRLLYYPVSAEWKADDKNRCVGENCPLCLKRDRAWPPAPVISESQSPEVQWNGSSIPLGQEATAPPAALLGNESGKGSAASPAPVEVPAKQQEKHSPFSDMKESELPPGPPTPLLNALRAGDQTGWKEMESDGFMLFSACNSTHISSDMYSAPYAHWSDGCWDIIIIRNASKGAVLKMFLSIEKGEHVRSPDVIYLKVRAFRLEPDKGRVGSFLDIDGERMPTYDAVECEMHRGLVNFIM